MQPFHGTRDSNVFIGVNVRAVMGLRESVAKHSNSNPYSGIRAYLHHYMLALCGFDRAKRFAVINYTGHEGYSMAVDPDVRMYLHCYSRALVHAYISKHQHASASLPTYAVCEWDGSWEEWKIKKGKNRTFSIFSFFRPSADACGLSVVVGRPHPHSRAAMPRWTSTP